jgi:hypothetical protein
VEDIFSSLEDLGFNVTNVRQMTAIWRAPNGQTHKETLPLFFVTLTRNIKSYEIFKLNNLNHVIIKVGLYRAQTGFTQCWPPAKRMPWKDKYRIYTELLHLHPSRRTESSSSVIPRLQPCKRKTAKEKSIINNELERMWAGVVIAYFKILSWHVWYDSKSRETLNHNC